MREFASRFQAAAMTVEEAPKPTTVEGKTEPPAAAEKRSDRVETENTTITDPVVEIPTDKGRGRN